ncbi:hypothetical protein ITP53_52660 [Nonomuraea sp. K274]|uniref:Uncharacterized protein n=1 Tax=Nonomuraea cypriaca TaxID=1187855 RepID=A0A931APR2_9ACTN|nr:hypothetical protein [Nonomuraea cypriaca]MBF8194185.1 hypothetical protein [Nonomuraea cypriaca]
MNVTVGPGSMIVTVSRSVTVTVGNGVISIAARPRFLYVPKPSRFVDVPSPAVTGISALTVLQDLPLHTLCCTEKRAPPSYPMEMFRYETPRRLTTFVLASYSGSVGVSVGVAVGLDVGVVVGVSDGGGVVVVVADGGGVVGLLAKTTCALRGLSVDRWGSVADVWVIAIPPAPASTAVPSSAPRRENLIILLLWEISGPWSLFRLVKIGQD